MIQQHKITVFKNTQTILISDQFTYSTIIMKLIPFYFLLKMNSDNSIKVDFKHFIKLTKANIMSWDSLSNLLNETTSTFHLSKELNQILLEELKRSETDLLKHLGKEKEVERITSNWIVESKSIGIQTEYQNNKEKETLEDVRMEDNQVDKPTEILSFENVERSFGIKPENKDENDTVVKEEDSLEI